MIKNLNDLYEDYIYSQKVNPFISRREEYLLYKKILKEVILPSKEMEGITERNLLKAREESITLLKTCILA